ncbi:MAG TPA: SGNH/GDSL hydrolase family protein [Armatimonadota bacterium]|nr:SGNH/GDSL hydrolase family protein [Armatimonadota bacterium]
MSSLLLQPGARILFQGDSVTDAGRSREDDTQLGGGYPHIIAAWLSARYPSLNLNFLNRGISGNRVRDLEERWTPDCVALQPDWVSILIGINDTWRRYDSNDPTPVPDYEACYRRILDRVKNETSARVMILEPFVLPALPDRVTWREDLDPRIAAARRIALDYKAIFIPLDGLFAAAAAQRGCAFWASDGVHPTQAGHALISQAWIQAVGGE